MHLLLHFIIPLIIAGLFFTKQWRYAFFIMIGTMVVDIDHLLATPIYDSLRCSIGFHPLHRTIPILIYFVACLFPKTRLLGIGLVTHMVLDSIDCQNTNGIWITT